MAEQSFPIVEQPMSADQWRSVTLGIGNGILDQGGFPYRLDGFDNASNTAKLRVSTTTGTATAIVAGHYHQLDEDMTIELPAVSATRTYYVMLQYDPLDKQSPVKVVAPTSIDDSQGKVNLHLWNVTRRANELLTDAAIRSIRPRVSTTATYASMSDLPQAHKVLWGSVAFIHGGRASDNGTIVMSMNDAAGDWYWKTIYDPNDEPDWVAVSDTTNAQSGSSGFDKAIQRVGPTRKIRGRVNRGSGGINYVPNSDSGYLFMSLSESDLPAAGFHTWAYGGGGTLVDVEVSRSRREVRFWVAGTCSYVDFGTIQWQVV